MGHRARGHLTDDGAPGLKVAELATVFGIAGSTSKNSFQSKI